MKTVLSIFAALLLCLSGGNARAFDADSTSFAWDAANTETAWGELAWAPSSVTPDPYTLLFHGAAPSSCSVSECTGLACFAAVTDPTHGQRVAPRCPGESGAGLSWALLDDVDGLTLATYNGPQGWWRPNASGIVATYASLIVDEVAAMAPFAGAGAALSVSVTASVADTFVSANYRQAQLKLNVVLRNPNGTPGQVELAGRLSCDGINCNDATGYDPADATQGGVPWIDGSFQPSTCTEFTTSYRTSELWCADATTDTQSGVFEATTFGFDVNWLGFLASLRHLTDLNGLDGDDDDDVNSLFGADSTDPETWRLHEVRLGEEVYSSLSSKAAHLVGTFSAVTCDAI